jgi:hypothetical protein
LAFGLPAGAHHDPALVCDHACRPTRSFRDGLEHVGDLKADLERGFAAWVGPELAKTRFVLFPHRLDKRKLSREICDDRIVVDTVTRQINTHFYGSVVRTITLRSPCGQIPAILAANAPCFKSAYTFAA